MKHTKKHRIWDTIIVGAGAAGMAAAIACKEYAFNVLNASTVYSIVRDTNTASQKVAVRNGMKIIDKDTKNFRYIDMDFFLYSAERTNEAQI